MTSQTGRGRRREAGGGRPRRGGMSRRSLGPSGDGDRGSRPRPTRRTDAAPGALAGAQTVPSARSATPTGRSTEPGPVRVTRSPAATPRSAERGRPTSTTGLRAVARMASSPSCIRPSSMSCFQEARTSSPSPRRGCGRRASRRRRRGSPSHGPTWVISSQTCRGPQAQRGARAPRRCRRAPAGRAASWGCAAPCRTGGPALPVDERAGPVGDRRDREDHVGGAR